jgi:hypothetical protein
MSARQNAKQFVLGASGEQNPNSLQSFGFGISTTDKPTNDNYQTQNNTTRQTAIRNVKSRPGESAVVTVPKSQSNAIPANDNQKVTEVANDNLTTTGKGDFVATGPGASVRGSKPVEQNPSGIKGQALLNVGKETAALVADPNFFKQKAANDNQTEPNKISDDSLGTQESNEIPVSGTESQNVLDRGVYLRPDETQEEESEDFIPAKVYVTPPIFMIAFVVIEYFAMLLFGIVGLVLSFIFPPAGIIIDVIVYIEKVSFGVLVYSWDYFYSNQTSNKISSLQKERKNLEKNIRRGEKIIKVFMKKGYLKAISVSLSFFPFMNVIWPTYIIVVFQSFWFRKREYNNS